MPGGGEGGGLEKKKKEEKELAEKTEECNTGLLSFSFYSKQSVLKQAGLRQKDTFEAILFNARALEKKKGENGATLRVRDHHLRPQRVLDLRGLTLKPEGKCHPPNSRRIRRS